MDNINIEPIIDEEEAIGEAVEITDEEETTEDTVTVELDGKEFQLVNPVILNTLFNYNEDHKIIKTEVDINAVLVGGGESKKESEFFYDDNGNLIKQVETSSEGTAESAVEYNEDGNIIKLESPLSIIEYDYIDDDNYVKTTKNKIKEIYTVETYKKYGDDFELISSITKTINDELVSEMTKEINIEEDTVKISAKNIFKSEEGETSEINSSAVCGYKSGLIMASDNITYGQFNGAHIEYMRDEKARLKQIVVSTPDGETKIINYTITENEEDQAYVTKSKYEAIYVKNSEDISINENTLFDPSNGGPISFTQNINSKGYNIECHINNAAMNNTFYQFETFNCNNDKDFSIDYAKLIDRANDNNIIKQAISASFRIGDTMYTINNGLYDIYTKVAIGKIIDGDLENQIEVNVKEADNKEIMAFIVDKLKEYVNNNEDIKSLLPIAKVEVSLLN